MKMSPAKAYLSSQLNNVIDQRQDFRQANVDLELRELQIKQQCETS